MRAARRSKPVLAVLLLTAVLAAAGCAPAGTPGGGAGGDHTSEGPPAATPARAALDRLTVAAPGSMRGYSRDRFPHWKRVGRGCDVRDSVLRRDGATVRSRGCNVTSGRWISPYDERTLTKLTEVDIDHVVPLANAWRSGAAGWTDGQRGAFANDLTRPQLRAVSATTNRAKGDRDPAQWKPPNQAQWCRYAVNWVTVKAYWKLSVTGAERRALEQMLETC
ncbi:hypothetical protein GCM10010123_44510 [Pilimelia anulata]|uniref:GmrSD restriction endonucleases C-terminal domain-containing protein n=1 Tax=Pilimelia anulata TaxID=53371 RepID=A0A8J3BK57_9ACTN|nr:HNH endonuclease family protein [Pilimelia anulata]GGK09716.1 hypothetical protein GCM10010123_44510 [Pilimelia anulata]